MKKNKNFSRRTFLSKSVTGLASIGLVSITGKTGAEYNNDKGFQESKKKIIYRTLGKTGIKVPVVNMGVMNAFDPELIRKSYEMGVRLFDTAHIYQLGQNEKMLGNAIEDLNARDKVIICTKVGIPDHLHKQTPVKKREMLIKLAEGSLKSLKTDYIDILYIHDVRNVETIKDPGTLEALILLKEQGKARFVGFTTHTNMTQCIKEAIQMDFYDVILTAYNYAMGDDTNLAEAIKDAAAKGIGIIAMKTQCAQYWYKEFVPRTLQNYYKGKIMHTAVLKWVLRNDNITSAIPGYANYQQMEEDFSVAYDLEYTAEEKHFLEDRNVKLSMGYCHQCYKCVPTCPKEVDIPTLMRTHMYAACYSNFYQARNALDNIPEGKNIRACSSCKTCTAICINQIDIGRRIDELKTIFI